MTKIKAKLAAWLSTGMSILTIAAPSNSQVNVNIGGANYTINYNLYSPNANLPLLKSQPWWDKLDVAASFAEAALSAGIARDVNNIGGVSYGPWFMFETGTSSPGFTYIIDDSTPYVGACPPLLGCVDNPDLYYYATANAIAIAIAIAPSINTTTLQPYADIQSISLDALKNQRELVLNTAGDCDQRGWVVYDSEKVKGKKPNKNKSLCVFAEGGYAQGAINGSTSVGGYDATNASSAYGIEWKPSKKWAVGAAYGYGSANLGNFGFQDTSAFINSNVNSGNIYGVYRPSKNCKIAALAGYSNFNFNGSRTYLEDTANSTFASNGYTAALVASYDIILNKDSNNKKNPLAPVRIKPLVGLAWGGNQQNEFSETGSGTLFNVQGNTTNSLMATFGATLEAPIPLNTKITTALIPKFGIAYQYDGLAVLDANKSITASEQTSSTTSFTEVGQNRGPSGIYLDLGGDLQINPSLVVYANVNYQVFTYGNQIGYQGGLRIKL